MATTRSFVFYLMLAIPTGFGLMFATAMWEIGPHRFWTRLLHPHVHAGAYDLLAASLVGAIAVLLGITAATFAAGAAIEALDDRRLARLRPLIDSRFWFFPATLLMYTITTLASAAYGFPRYSSAILVQAALGVGAWLAFVLLNAEAAGMILTGRRRRRTGGGPPSNKATSPTSGDTDDT